MGGRLLLPLSLAAKMKGEGTEKVGRCFSMGGRGREGGREGGVGMEKTEREKLWGGEINPLPSKVEVSRLSPPEREWRRTPPSHGGGANLPPGRKEFGGLNGPSGEKPRGTRADSLRGVPTRGRAEVSAGPRPPRWRERKGAPQEEPSLSRDGQEEGGRRGSGAREKRRRRKAQGWPEPALPFPRHREGDGVEGRPLPRGSSPGGSRSAR